MSPPRLSPQPKTPRSAPIFEKMMRMMMMVTITMMVITMRAMVTMRTMMMMVITMRTRMTMMTMMMDEN